jgi:hypothetical protein
VSAAHLRAMAENAWRAAFAPPEEIAEGLRGLESVDFGAL